jgi:hypothetical protein
MSELTLEQLDARLKKIENMLAPKAFMTCPFKEHDEATHGPRGQWFRLNADSKADHTCPCGYSGMYSDSTKFDKLPRGTFVD